MIEVIKVEDCGENIGDYDIPIHNAIIIPNNATNGDIIEAMFPDAMVYDAGIVINVEFSENEENWYNKDWWNAPYKKLNNI